MTCLADGPHEIAGVVEQILHRSWLRVDAEQRLDGLHADEAQRVESAVVAAATRLPVPTRAVIVDRRGISDPDDWNALALHDGPDVPILPDGVIAQHPIAERILRAAPGLAREEEAGGLWSDRPPSARRRPRRHTGPRRAEAERQGDGPMPDGRPGV